MAARIAGVTLPPNKKIIISLSYIFGIGLSLSKKILEEAKINKDTPTDNLNESEVNKLRDIIENRHRVEGELKREILFFSFINNFINLKY